MNSIVFSRVFRNNIPLFLFIFTFLGKQKQKTCPLLHRVHVFKNYFTFASNVSSFTTTSCAPPSTILVEDTSVNFESF